MSEPDKSKRQGALPAFTLMILAPLVAEVLSGATRLSFIFVFIPEVLVWGGGALLVRELARRWKGGWTRMLLLGLCLSIAEEFLIQQTSLAPLPWLGDAPTYGRLWGVNWIFFLYMLGYESVWVVLVPVQLTELIYREPRHEPWLKTRGMVIVSILFLLGSFLAWFSWTQRARPMVFHVAKYVPPLLTMASGALAIAVLALLAYFLRTTTGIESAGARRAPSAWAVGVVTFFLGAAWWTLLALVFGLRLKATFWIPMAAGMAWAAMAFVIVCRWASSTGWTELHRWTIVSSAILVCMALGFLGSSSRLKMDVIGKVILNLIAVALLILLGRKIRQQESS
jgi:hypothetical protein